jgi:hypothetical protein
MRKGTDRYIGSVRQHARRGKQALRSRPITSACSLQTPVGTRMVNPGDLADFDERPAIMAVRGGPRSRPRSPSASRRIHDLKDVDVGLRGTASGSFMLQTVRPSTTSSRASNGRAAAPWMPRLFSMCTVKRAPSLADPALPPGKADGWFLHEFMLACTSASMQSDHSSSGSIGVS